MNPFIKDDLAGISTEEIPSADIPNDLVTAYQKWKVPCIQYSKD